MISNGSTQYYDNTLTRFTNQLSDLYTKKNSAFEVAVSQLIIDDRFQSVGVPQNDSMPTMILSKLKPTDIVCKKRNEISDNEKYFLPPSYYRHLSSFCETKDVLNHTPISIWCHEPQTNQRHFGYFESPKSKKLASGAYDHYLYIFFPLAKLLLGKQYEEMSIKSIEIDTVIYCYFEINNNGVFFTVGQDVVAVGEDWAEAYQQADQSPVRGEHSKI